MGASNIKLIHELYNKLSPALMRIHVILIRNPNLDATIKSDLGAIKTNLDEITEILRKEIKKEAKEDKEGI